MNSFYSKTELERIGFLSIGSNLMISRKASFYGVERMALGDSVRIDDFCILSGEISIGSHSHISAYCALYGNSGIAIGEFSGLSPKCVVFSEIDDFGGDYLIGPMSPIKHRNISKGLVQIKSFCQVGSSSVVFPNLTIEDGVAIGALSLVNCSLSGWGIYAGIPVKFIRERQKGLLQRASELKSFESIHASFY